MIMEYRSLKGNVTVKISKRNLTTNSLNVSKLQIIKNILLTFKRNNSSLTLYVVAVLLCYIEKN